MMKTSFIYLFFIMMGMLSACQYEKPIGEEPMKSDYQVSKSSFFKASGSPKTFACGWAALNEVGWFAEAAVLHNVNSAFHCNVEFEILQNSLVGKMVNPSFPNDRSKWQVVVEIPIRNHFYREKEKDQYGRETINTINNANRSDWSARPNMELDLSRIQIRNWSFALLPGEMTGSSYDIKDIEWDQENGFLGFTVSLIHSRYGSEAQVDLRFNFMAFEHNEKFVKTPYNDQNSKYVNVLHIMGQKANGVYPILFGSKWDLTKRHDFYLINVPEDKVEMVKHAVHLWNESLIEIGALDKKSYLEGKAGFYTNTEKKSKYNFDLRYPSIYWESDKRISENSPLGIGLALADVRNGELIWGGVNLYVGTIESYLKSSMPIASQNSPQGKYSLDISEALSFNNRIQLPPMMDSLQQSDVYNLNQDLTQLLTHIELKALQTQAPELSQLNSSMQNEISKNSKYLIAQFDKNIHQKRSELTQALDSYALSQIIGIDHYFTDAKKEFFGQSKAHLSKEDLQKMIEKKKLSFSGLIMDEDVTFKDVYPSLMAALKSGLFDEEKALITWYKDLVIHEFGHVLGLGHNFKENILPDSDKVPSYIYKDLKSKSTAEAKYVNFTTVMGYRHPYSVLASKIEDIKPGIHDLHVLRYLYRNQYVTFRKGGKDEYTYFELPKDGIIPRQTQSARDRQIYDTAYVPSCNDIDASYSLDPFCNRHDYGSDAASIIDSYMNTIKDNIVSSQISAIDARGGNAEWREYAQSYSAWTRLGRVRLFYDYMRRKYSTEIAKISNDEEALYSFSEACQQDLSKIQNKNLKEIFSNQPELKELCQVNGRVIDELTSFLSKPISDSTLYDFDNRYVPGNLFAGDGGSDYSRMLGTWRILTNLPLKMASLGTLTNPRPLMIYNTPYGSFLAPVMNYAIDSEAGYSYSTLYPKQFTKAISETVSKNVHLSNLSSGYSHVGQSVLSLGYFLWRNLMSNDAAKFSNYYMTNIRSQNNFSVSVVAVVMNAIPHPDYPDLVNKFSGFIYDFRTGQSADVSEIYILPKGEVLVRTDKMFVYAMTRIQFTADNKAFVFGYRFDYEKEPNDPLFESSVKKTLKDMYNDVFDSCVVGKKGPDEKLNGIGEYFGTEKFVGFRIPKGVATNEVKHLEFLKSVDEEYEKYYNSDFSNPPSRDTCIEAKRGMGILVSTAAVLNGFWLPELVNAVKK